ncbi:MAG: hypothetical protein EOO43_23790, partial [Flavobacterium sp.]
KHIDDYLTEWLTGNDLAFNSIIDHYYPRLMAAGQKMLPNKEDAEELVMNVFLKIWQHKDQLSHVLKFDNYLFGILRQQIVRNARKNVLETVFDFNGTNLTVERCPSITLDKYCEGKIAEVDFLKIDIEGHELAALEGATELLKDGRIKLIQFEFNEFNLQSKSTFLRFYETLKNFTFYRIMPNGSLTPMGPYDSSLEIYRYQNILCVLQ